MTTNIALSLKYALSLTALAFIALMPIKTSYAQAFSFPANKNEAVLQDRIASDAQVEKLLQQREQEHTLRLKALGEDEQNTIRQINARIAQAQKEETQTLAASRQRQKEALAALDLEFNTRKTSAQKEQSDLLTKMEAEKTARLKSIQVEEDNVRDVTSKKIEALKQTESLALKAHALKMASLERDAQLQQDRIDTANQAYLKLSGTIATAQETLQSLNTRISDAKSEDAKQAQILEANNISRQNIVIANLKREKEEDAQRASERALRIAAALNDEQKTLQDTSIRIKQILTNEETAKKESIARIELNEEKAKNESASRIASMLSEETTTVSETKKRIEQLLANEASLKKESEHRITTREQEEKDAIAKIEQRQTQKSLELETGINLLSEKIKALDTEYSTAQNEAEKMYASKKQAREQETLNEAQEHSEKMKVLREKNLAQRKTLEDINAKNEAAVNNRLQQMLNTETERQEQVARRKQQDEKYLIELSEKINAGTQLMKTTNKELERLSQELGNLQNEKQARKLKLCNSSEPVKPKTVNSSVKIPSNLSQDGKALPLITVTPDETVVPTGKVN